MQFHISSTWSFSSGHPASEEHSALQKSLVGWPGFPVLAVPFQVMDMPGILTAHHWQKSCSHMGQPELSATRWYSNFMPFPLLQLSQAWAQTFSSGKV